MRRSSSFVLAGVAALALLPGVPRPAGAAGVVSLVSHSPASATTTGDGLSASGAPSADGAFVVFVSSAANLVPGQVDLNGDLDVFLLNRATGEVALASHVPGSVSTTANGISSTASISGDGSYVVFASTATDLVTGQADINDSSDVFLYERATGAVRLVSHATTGPTTTADGTSGSPSISGDGRFVAFQSTATDVVAGQTDGNDTFDAFLFDRATGGTTLVSHTAGSATTAATHGAGVPSISANGTFVVFASFSTNLVAGQVDSNRTFDVFLFERSTGVVTLVSHRPGAPAAAASGFSWAPSVSADGDFVAFQSDATDLVAGQIDVAGTLDAFLFQPSTGGISLVSHTPAGPTMTGDAGTGIPTISADGAFVAFPSFATNLVAGQVDTNGASDVFLFQRATGAVTLVSHTAGHASATANGASDAPSLSADGATVVFQSWGTDLMPGQADANGDLDVFRYERGSGAVNLVSHRADRATTTGNAFSALPRISESGTAVTFDSDATDLVAGQQDANATTDVFVSAAGRRGQIPADFDGDGDTDIAVFRPSNGYWFVNGGPAVQFGTSGDIPVPADYDGDGDTDIAVFRPSNGYWFVNGGPAVQFGTSGDIPVPGDYDGDGDTDIAVFRPSNGYWFVNGGPSVQFGTTGDIPVPGDYDGDGDTDIAVFRPSNGYWFVNGGPSVQFGTTGDIPVPADFDGDGDTDITVFRPSNGYWFVLGGAITQFGASGDRPLPLPAAITPA